MAKAKQKLSYEELEKRLAEVQAQNKKFEEKLQNLEEKTLDLKIKNKVLESENKQLKVVKQVFTDIFNEISVNVVGMFSGEPLSDADMLLQCKKIVPILMHKLTENKILKSFFKRGNESIKVDEYDKQLEHKLNNKFSQVRKVKLSLSQALNYAQEALQEVKGSDNPILQSACEIVDRCDRHSDWTLLLSEPTSPKGRQVSQADLPNQSFEVNKTKNRCQCGAQLISIGQQYEECKNINLELADVLSQCQTQIAVSQCPACHSVHADIDDNAPLPVLPNQTVSQETLIEMMSLVHNGMPLNRCQSVFLEPMRLGNDTISRQRLLWTKIYLQPLVKAILKSCRDTEVLLSDETTYDCLQSQGKGSSQVLEKTSSQSYVLALSNASAEVRPFLSYHYMRSRSATCINEVINEHGFNPDVLVSDGYAAYPSVIKQSLPTTGHQSCLIHFRREIYRALDVEQLMNEFKNLTNKELKAHFRQQVLEGNTMMVLMSVLDGLSQVYQHENTVRERRSDETLQEYYDRVRQIRRSKIKPIMDSIDKVMKGLASEATELKGGRYVKKGSAYWAAACVYYMNQRDALRYFLADPRVPCDTNIVERAIRPLTIIRKNSYFSQSVEGMKSLCDCFTLFETARLNGIDAEQWLRDYGRALFKYCYEKGWEEELAKGKNPEKKIMQWDFCRLQEGFDFDVWLPWNYKKS